jgi:hypothetical protein
MVEMIYRGERRNIMAKDSSGKKYNRIPEHKREVNGKTITVREHVRSNRTDSKGAKKN